MVLLIDLSSSRALSWVGVWAAVPGMLPPPSQAESATVDRATSAAGPDLKCASTSDPKGLDGRLGLGSLVPWEGIAVDEQTVLVALAGKHDGVAGAGPAYDVADRLPAVGDAAKVLTLAPARCQGPLGHHRRDLLHTLAPRAAGGDAELAAGPWHGA